MKFYIIPITTNYLPVFPVKFLLGLAHHAIVISVQNIIKGIFHCMAVWRMSNIMHQSSQPYSLKDDIENAGAIFTDEPAVIDSRIITTAHYKDLGPWMRATINAVV